MGILKRIKEISDFLGSILTLVAVPSAIFALVKFYEEIGDLVTDPDTAVVIESVSLRCALINPPEYNTDIPIDDYYSDLQHQCNNASVSAWVTLTFVNKDSVNRKLIDVYASLKLPEDDILTKNPVELTIFRELLHIIENDYEVVELRPLPLVNLEPEQELNIELDFRPFKVEDQQSFEIIYSKIVSESIIDQEFHLTVFGRYPGSSFHTALGRCTIHFDEDLIARAIQKQQNTMLRAITIGCVNTET